MKYYDYVKQLTQLRLKIVPPLHPGAFIRDKRISLNLTLDELAEHICSPSTLSKIETGQQQATPALLSKLYQKLNLSEPLNLKRIKWVEAIRFKLYHQDISSLKEVLPTLPFHYQTCLLKFIISILNQNIIHAKKQMLPLKSLILYMSLEELQLYFLFLGKYYHHLNEGLLTKNYYHLSYDIAVNLLLPDPLLLLSLAEYYSLTNDSIKAIHLTQKALDLFKESYSIKYVIDCELLLIHAYIQTELFSKAFTLIQQLKLKLDYADSYHQGSKLFIYYGDYYFALKDYPMAENMYLKAFHDPCFTANAIASLMKLYYHSEQHSKIQPLVNHLQPSNL
ncbi:MAG: helix-turn-helix domain-containing protein [Turicibacter sp.]|nr:helix-turn-helix domain-containing protein [Turicibacter sp.]